MHAAPARCRRRRRPIPQRWTYVRRAGGASSFPTALPLQRRRLLLLRSSAGRAVGVVPNPRLRPCRTTLEGDDRRRGPVRRRVTGTPAPAASTRMNERLERAMPAGGSPPTIWERRLLDECRRAERGGQSFVLIVLSLDPGSGSLSAEALDLVGDSLRSDVRQSDVVAQVGPAAYAIVLFGARPEFAAGVGERLVRHVRGDAGSLVRALGEIPIRFGAGVF